MTMTKAAREQKKQARQRAPGTRADSMSERMFLVLIEDPRACKRDARIEARLRIPIQVLRGSLTQRGP